METNLHFIGITNELSLMAQTHTMVCFEFAFLMQTGVHYQDAYVAFLNSDKNNLNPIFLN